MERPQRFCAVLRAILQSSIVLNRCSVVYETNFDRFSKGAWSTRQQKIACLSQRGSDESEGMEHCKNRWFLMIFTLRVSLKYSSKTKEAVKRRSGNRTYIHERFAVIFSVLRGQRIACLSQRGGDESEGMEHCKNQWFY